jgi:hypothetical protein
MSFLILENSNIQNKLILLIIYFIYLLLFNFFIFSGIYLFIIFLI